MDHYSAVKNDEAIPSLSQLRETGQSEKDKYLIHRCNFKDRKGKHKIKLGLDSGDFTKVKFSREGEEEIVLQLERLGVLVHNGGKVETECFADTPIRHERLYPYINNCTIIY